MRKFSAYFSLLLLRTQNASGWAARAYDIRRMTPETEQAFTNRKSRHEELRRFKAEGRIRENNHGYVEVLDKSSALEGLARAENADRRIIYTAIVEQNGLGPNGMPQVEAVFAGVRRDKAKPGDWIQLPSGAWVQK